MSYTLIRPVESAEPARFVPVHRHYEQPGYNDRQNSSHDKENKNKDGKQLVLKIKSVKRNPKTGDLTIQFENGTKKTYSCDDPMRQVVEEGLEYQGYGRNFDFRA